MGWEVYLRRGIDTGRMEYAFQVFLVNKRRGLEMEGSFSVAHEQYQMIPPQPFPVNADGLEGLYFPKSLEVDVRFMAHQIMLPDSMRGMRLHSAEYGSAIPDGRYGIPLRVFLVDVEQQEDKPEEIIIPEEPTLLDMLERIKEAQRPKAQELLRKEVREGRRVKTAAKILTFDNINSA